MALARLTRREEFEQVLLNGRRKSSRNFSVRGRENGRDTARLGLIASRKAAPRAVDRNRCKRLARDTFRILHPELPCIDFVVQLRSNLRGVQNEVLREELRKLFSAVSSGPERS